MKAKGPDESQSLKQSKRSRTFWKKPARISIRGRAPGGVQHVDAQTGGRREEESLNWLGVVCERMGKVERSLVGCNDARLGVHKPTIQADLAGPLPESGFGGGKHGNKSGKKRSSLKWWVSIRKWVIKEREMGLQLATHLPDDYRRCWLKA